MFFDLWLPEKGAIFHSNLAFSANIYYLVHLTEIDVVCRNSLIILFIITFIGCSNNGAEKSIEAVIAGAESAIMANSNPGNISAVCGVFYKVDDFNIWHSRYNQDSLGTIIILRNVSDPSLVMTFEGGQSQAMMEARAAVLTNDEFLTEASVVSDPVVSYYVLHYMSQSDPPAKYFVALIFDTDDIKQLLANLARDINIFTSYGLRPVGIGTDPFDTEQVYMLLSLDDFVSFKKQTNSPRKMNKFLRQVNMPAETGVATWSRTEP